MVSTTSFFGGGESFIANVLQKIEGKLYFVVASDELFNSIKSEFKFSFHNKSFIKRLNFVNELIQREKIDVVILNGGNSIYFAPFINSSKCVIYRHTTLKSYYNLVKRICVAFLQNIAFCYAKKIIHVSKYSSKEQFLVTNRRKVIHNGVAIQPCEKIKNNIPVRVKFLFLGRTEKAKGVDIIVSAFIKLKKEGYNLDVVGCGEMDSYLRSLDNSNICYHGFDKEVAKYYKNSSVLISLPKAEAFGLTLVEAMSYGCPVISCATGGIPEIVESGYNGYIINRDVNSLIQSIKHISESPDRLYQMSMNAYNTASSKFNVERTIENINKVINEL